MKKLFKMTAAVISSLCLMNSAVPAYAAESYKDVLNSVLNSQKYEEIEFEPMEGLDISGNSFGICDVNGDGQKELIINWDNTFVAGQKEVIFSKDASGKIYCMGEAGVSAEYYDNGMIVDYWSHNQSLSSDFLPYSLKKYNPDSKKYELVAMVTAWNKSEHETDESGNAFPDSADTSGTGQVYYVTLPENGQITGYYDSAPMDSTEYRKWFNGKMETASCCMVPQYWYLNTNNFDYVCQKQENATSGQSAANGDHNRDGNTDAGDAALILQYAAAFGSGNFSGTLGEYAEKMMSSELG